MVIPSWKDARTTVSSMEMDAIGFGIGCCCLKTTTEFSSLPVILHGSIAGLLSDCFSSFRRFSNLQRQVIVAGRSLAVDDKTEVEKAFFKKSRFSSASCYLSMENEEFKDLELPMDLHVYHSLLQEAKMTTSLVKHYAHMWIRDPLVASHNSLRVESLIPQVNSTVIRTLRQLLEWMQF